MFAHSNVRFAGLLAAFLVLVAGRSARANDETIGKVTVTGTTVDEDGKPVADVEVSARTWRKATESVKSDSDGAFRLSVPTNAVGGISAAVLANANGGRLGVLRVYQANDKRLPIKVVLKPAKTLRVRVNDAEGKPVKGADVHFSINLQAIVNGRTEANGQWTAQVPADALGWGVYALKSKIGFDYAVANAARGATTVSPLPEQLTLTLDGARTPLRVKAVDNDGKPLAGVEVGPWLITKPGHGGQMNGMGEAFPKTDADGVATLDWLPSRVEGGLQILAYSNDHAAIDHAISIPPDKPTSEVTITLLPIEQLSGRVTTADGKPAADVIVAAEGQGSGMNTARSQSRTDANGRYNLRVNSEHAYIINATKGDLAAPYKWGVIVHAGKPVKDVDLVLGRATRLKGQVTVGKDRKPAPNISVQAIIDKGSIPDEIKKKGDRYYHAMSMRYWKQTDSEGRYDFVVGPGDYTIWGPERVAPIKLTIPAENPPLEVVHDLAMPRAENGPFTATVVGIDGKPVPAAVLDGAYEASKQFSRIQTGADGTIKFERSLDPLTIRAESPDRSLATIVHSEAEAAETRIALKPAAIGSGRLVDPSGKPIAAQKLSYGIRVHQSPTRNSAFSWYFGGTITTDAQGHFELPGLVVGETYDLYNYDDSYSRIFTAKATVRATAPGPLALGDLVIDFNPPAPTPYVAPTPAQRTAEAFAARKEKSPQEKLAYTLIEAKREYTRPLLLFGNAKDPACIDAFRLFNESSEDDPAAKDKPRAKTAADLRWEFELASIDTARPEGKSFAESLKISLAEGRPPVLAVLSDQGGVTQSYTLQLGADKKLDPKRLAAFLLEHKLPTRDAETMLADALVKAKAEDKRVFLILSASWCGPCRLLARFLSAHKTELNPHYIFVKLDISRDTHADALRLRYEGKDAANGVPWYVILDATGKPLITSNAKDLEADYGSSNVGFPSEKPGIEHFLKMLKQTSPKLSDAALAALRQSLEKKP